MGSTFGKSRKVELEPFDREEAEERVSPKLKIGQQKIRSALFSIEATTGIRSKIIRHIIIDNIHSLYEEKKLLGEGSSGSVVEVIQKSTGNVYAMKQLKKIHCNQAMLDNLRMEIELLKEMDHPNTIKLYDTCEDKTKFYLIMEVILF